MRVDKSELVHHWLKHHFKLGTFERTLSVFLLEFFHMNEADHLDLRFAAYRELRTDGVQVIKSQMYIEDLLEECQNNRWNPCRFADYAKQVGYMITFCISSFCWIVLLVYTIQFANEEGDLRGVWQGEVVQNVWMDILVLQPLILVGSAFLIYEVFKCCFSKDFTTAQDIRSRDLLANSLAALLEKERKELCDKWLSEDSVEMADLSGQQATHSVKALRDLEIRMRNGEVSPVAPKDPSSNGKKKPKKQGKALEKMNNMSGADELFPNL